LAQADDRFDTAEIIVQRIWAILFGLTSVAVALLFVGAMQRGWWFPATVSDAGRTYDELFGLFLLIITVAFIGTQATLAWCLWRYRRQTGRTASYLPGNLRLEAVWTLVPTIILASLAIYQMESWAKNKINRPDSPPLARVVGRQFQWDVVYPGPDGRLGTADDLFATDGELHVPLGEVVVLELRSVDVIHSFFVPALRLKQDLVPGIDHSVWFTADTPGEFDIICAELCGWGHSRMRGRLIIESPEAYAQFLDELTTAQSAASINE
jgi:cytochrome c oxidase subunit 2